MMAKPHLNVSFHSYSYHHRLFHPMPCTSSSLSYMHHNSSISDLSFCSCKPRYMLLLELFNTVLMKTIKIHSPPQTLTHNLTPSSLHLKLPLNSPIIPIASKFHPNLSYPINIFLWKPTNQSSGGVVDDVAIHFLYNSPFSDLNTI